MSLPLYTLSLFMPTIIKALGYQAAVAQLLTIPPYAVSFLTTLVVAVLSERTGHRAIFIAGSSLVAAVGVVRGDILRRRGHLPGHGARAVLAGD